MNPNYTHKQHTQVAKTVNLWLPASICGGRVLSNVEVALIIQCYSPHAKSVSSFTTFSTPSGDGPGIKGRIPGMPFDL